jgi:hypothetical protein
MERPWIFAGGFRQRRSMTATRLFKLPVDPERVDSVREYFTQLEDRRETFERGLALEKMNAEAAWLDEREPALYYLHEESDSYPVTADPVQSETPICTVLLENTHARPSDRITPVRQRGRTRTPGGVSLPGQVPARRRGR